MSAYDRAAINDLSHLLRGEYAAIRFGDLREIRWDGFQGLGARTIATSVKAVARHARQFILDEPEMRILCLDRPDCRCLQQHGHQYRHMTSHDWHSLAPSSEGPKIFQNVFFVAFDETVPNHRELIVFQVRYWAA
jgi:hypothetical protein